MIVGPRNPLETIGEPVVLSAGIIRQDYKDGFIFQIKVERGDYISSAAQTLDSIHGDDDGEYDDVVWMGLHEEGDSLYLGLWAAKK